MNIFKKIYCRLYQGIFRIVLPFLPYREPKILSDYSELVKTVREEKIQKVLIVTDATINKLGLLRELENSLKVNDINYIIFDNVVANPTIQNVENGLKVYNDNGCVGIITLGGGSAMDTAKAIGARIVNPNKTIEQMKGLMKVKKQLPMLIAIPTTAGTGSETTVCAVITNSETKHKYAINDFPLIPKYALLDPKLTIGLPPHITSTTGLDALTHAIEAYIGRSTTRRTRECSLKAIDMIFNNITIAYNDGKNIVARKNMLTASYLAGVAFTKSYVGYVHAIAHSLGGFYGVPHGLANAVILPYVLKKYDKSIHKKCKEIAVYCNLVKPDIAPREAFKVVVDKILELNTKMLIPTCIEALKNSDIDKLVAFAVKEANPLYPVPKEFDKVELKEIYLQIANK